MNVVLMGPPGAGKGTQADFIKGIFPLAYISTGDIFREAVSKQTSLGLEAQKYMVEGKLVHELADELVVMNAKWYTIWSPTLPNPRGCVINAAINWSSVMMTKEIR